MVRTLHGPRTTMSSRGRPAWPTCRADEAAFLRWSTSICDKICSQFATHATLAALFHRERTGEGQFVEVPMLESMVGFNLVEHHAGGSFKPPLGPMGYDRTMAEHRRPYATKDGFVCVLPYNEKQWKAFFVLMGRDEMVDDIRINDAKVRSERIGELYEMVAELVADWTSDELLEALENADVPNGRSVPLAELAEDPHLAAVKLIEEVDHPSEGTIKMVRPSVKMSKSPASIRSLPESLGERSVEVLSEAGVSKSEIDTLLEAGITIDGRQQAAKRQIVMAGRLDGKAALISGAAQGIGLAIAQAYALEGARVYGLDINANTLNDAFSRLSDETPQTVAWAECDVTDEVAVRRAIGCTVSTGLYRYARMQCGDLDLERQG